MTLENMLRKKLADAAAASTPEVALAYNGWNARLRPQTQDSVGCVLGELTVERTPPQGDGDPRAWAERISRNVTGLLEPLKLLEVDVPRSRALLRSATPAPKDPGLRYYEVELHGTSTAQVRRFQASHEAGRKREQVPFTLTYETLAKLIDDLVAND